MSEQESQELQPGQPKVPAGFFINRQYLNDLSVENPVGRIPDEDVPKVQQGMEGRVFVSPMEGENRFRVDMQLQLKAAVDARTVFLTEITYRVEVELVGIAGQAQARVLCVEVPTAVFSAMQEILQHNAGYAGYPEMRIAPLDYQAIFDRDRQPDAAAQEPGNATL